MKVTSSSQLLLPPCLQKISEMTSFVALKILTVKIFLPASHRSPFLLLPLPPSCSRGGRHSASLSGWMMPLFQELTVVLHVPPFDFTSRSEQGRPLCSTGDPGVTGGKPVSRARKVPFVTMQGPTG